MNIQFKTETKSITPTHLRLLTEIGQTAHVTWKPDSMCFENQVYTAHGVAIDRDTSDAPIRWLKDTIIDITAHNDTETTALVSEFILTGEKEGCIICKFENLE